MSVRRDRNHPWVLCLWSLLAVLIEVGLYASYRGHDARFHWFTHFFVGTSTALLIMAGVAWRSGRPVSVPVAWLLLGHLLAMTPDLLFAAGIAHRRWMDIFLGHITSHYMPGRNVTWYVVFAMSLALYLGSRRRSPPDPSTGPNSVEILRRAN